MLGPKYGRWVSLFMAWLAMMMVGANFSFNLYSNAIKETFNITQTQEDYLIVMLTTGMDNGILPAILSQFAGTQVMALAGLLLTGPGYFLTWSAFSAKEFYSRNSGLLILYFAMSGFGTSFLFLASLIVAIENFHPKHRGKSVGLVEATMAGVAPTVFSILYAAVFSNNEYLHPSRQHVQDFMLFLAIGSSVAFFLSVIFLRVYPYEVNEETTPLLSGQKEGEKAAPQGSLSGADEVEVISGSSCGTCAKICAFLKKSTAYLFTVEMQCLMWSFAILASVNAVFYHNNAMILVSGNNNRYIPLITILQASFSILSALVASTVSDYFIDRIPRLVYVLVFSAVQTVSQILLAFFSDKYPMIVFATLMTGGGNGLVWNLVVTAVSEIMGVKNFGRNWGTITLCYAILNYLVQFMFGTFYDMHADAHHNCMGTVCYSWTFSICAVLCFLATVLIFVLLVRRKNPKALS